jgi:hypothetical protein
MQEASAHSQRHRLPLNITILQIVRMTQWPTLFVCAVLLISPSLVLGKLSIGVISYWGTNATMYNLLPANQNVVALVNPNSGIFNGQTDHNFGVRLGQLSSHCHCKEGQRIQYDGIRSDRLQEPLEVILKESAKPRREFKHKCIVTFSRCLILLVSSLTRLLSILSRSMLLNMLS